MEGKRNFCIFIGLDSYPPKKKRFEVAFRGRSDLYLLRVIKSKGCRDAKIRQEKTYLHGSHHENPLTRHFDGISWHIPKNKTLVSELLTRVLKFAWRREVYELALQCRGNQFITNLMPLRVARSSMDTSFDDIRLSLPVCSYIL